MSEDKIVEVYSKDGRHISNCTYKRAKRKIVRKSAIWCGENKIKLTQDESDREALREYVFKRDNYTCYICDTFMGEGHPDLTIDHIRPKFRNGQDTADNWACCCSECNEIKGHTDLKDLVSPEKMQQINQRIDDFRKASRPNGRIYTEKLGLLSNHKGESV